jgi:hypothetical protein
VNRLVKNNSQKESTQNCDNDADAMPADGRSFQMRDAATRNAQSPIVDRRVIGKTHAVDDDDLSRRLDSRSATRVSATAR